MDVFCSMHVLKYIFLILFTCINRFVKRKKRRVQLLTNFMGTYFLCPRCLLIKFENTGMDRVTRLCCFSPLWLFLNTGYFC
jgi:hypothetical protein